MPLRTMYAPHCRYALTLTFYARATWALPSALQNIATNIRRCNTGAAMPWQRIAYVISTPRMSSSGIS